MKHKIELSYDIPFKQRYRRIPPSMFDEVRNHLQQLLSAGIIRRSHSPFASNVVLVKKKTGELRLCIDFRELNQRTIKDSYSLPRIEEILDSLSGNKYFSILDMKSGYHQIEIEESHKERTAFTVGPLGFYEYNRMAFGLANAPATYQRLMEQCLGELHLSICFIYLDDIIIFSRTYEEHLERLCSVFQKLRETGIKLSPKKCSLLKTRVKYVGHIVSEKGIEPDNDKITKVLEWPRPSSREEVRQFLGFIGYYRKFIKSFSKIARPLLDLMPTPTKKSRGRKKASLSPPPDFKWGEEQENSFNFLKNQLSSYPILSYPDYSKPFELHTDASLHGLGAVLYQEKDDGLKHVIAYASRSLNKAERNYPAHKLEFLALKWSVTEKFKDYLYGQNFTVFTDNNPLTYVLTTAQLDATGHRWLAALSAYNFDLKYRPGNTNADADALSRLPGLLNKQNNTTVASDSVSAICNMTSVIPFIESLPVSEEVINMNHSSLHSECLQSVDIVQEQIQDPDIAYWFDKVFNKYKPNKGEIPPTPFSNSLYKCFEKLRIIDDKLYRDVTTDTGIIHQLVLPLSLVKLVLFHIHDKMGHQGRDRTLSLAKDRFYWYGMTRDIENHIQHCGRCIRRKTPTNMKAPLVSITTSQPLELVCLDFLTLERSKGGFEYVLVMTDHFSRFAMAIPTKNMTAKTTAEVFYQNFIVHYGTPQKIHSDQGANFESKIIQELCSLLGMQKSRTTPYHPMGNGQCERFNRTLISMLGTLNPDEKQDWKSYIKPIVQAYNCTRQDSTSFSPFYLMFGREPNLPIDVMFDNIPHVENTSKSKYIESLRNRLKFSHDLASKYIQASQERQKKNYDVKIKSSVLNPGDLVLVKVVAFDGRHKLSDKWENEPYVVMSQPNVGIPVYKVQKQSGIGKPRVLHRNLLLPIGSSIIDKPKPVPRKRKPIPRKRKQSNPTTDSSNIRPCVDKVDIHSMESTSDSENESFILHNANIEYQEPVEVDRTINNTAATESDNTSIELLDPDHNLQNAANEQPTVDLDTHDSNSSLHQTNMFDESVPRTIESNISLNEREITIQSPEGSDSDNEPSVVPRRSVRVKSKPQWMRNNEYVFSQVKIPDWKSRAEYLQSLTTTVFKDVDGKTISDALIKIITESAE